MRRPYRIAIAHSTTPGESDYESDCGQSGEEQTGRKVVRVMVKAGPFPEKKARDPRKEKPDKTAHSTTSGVLNDGSDASVIPPPLVLCWLEMGRQA